MNKNTNEKKETWNKDENTIKSPLENGQYLIQPDWNDYRDKEIFNVFFKLDSEEDWEFQCDFDTREECVDWVKEEIDNVSEQSRNHIDESKANERSSGEWVSMDSLINEEEDDDEFDDEFEPDYHIGEHVIWDDPDGEPTDGWTITDIKQTGDGIVYVLNNDDGSEAEVLENEIYLDDNYKIDESSGTLEHLAHKYQSKIGEALGVLKNFQEESSKYAPTCEYELVTAIENLEAVKEWVDVGVEEGFDGVDIEDVDESSTDSEKKEDDEIKNAPKKFKNDKGSTSELVTGCSKKQVSEMTIQQDIDDAEQLCEMLWGQGKSNLRELLDSGISSPEGIMSMIEDMMGAEIPTLTALNDLLAYDFESLLESLGADVEQYRDSLDIIKRKDDSVELESTGVESTEVEPTK